MDVRSIPFASPESAASGVRWTATGILCGNETFLPDYERLVTRRNGIRPIPFEPAERGAHARDG
jgi:hypothetical protein